MLSLSNIKNYAQFSLELTQTNSSSANTSISYSNTFPQILFNNTPDKNYRVGVTRLSIPTSNIELLKFSDPTQYQLGFSGYNQYQVTDGAYGGYTNYVTSLPNSASNGVYYYTLDIIIEMMNRAYMKSFASYLKSYGISGSSFVGTNNLVVPTAITGTSSVFSSAGTTQYGGTVSNIYPNFALCELTISNLTIPNELNSGLATGEQIEIYIAHGGINVVVFQGTSGQLQSLLSNAGGSITFTEHSYNNIFLSNTGTTDVKFFESILAFQTVASTGTWNVGVSTLRNTFTGITFSFSLQLYAGNATSTVQIPNQSPYLSIDPTTSSLTLSYQSVYQSMNMQFLNSPALTPVINFFPDSVFNSSTGLYSNIYSYTILPSTLTTIITLTQSVSTLYYLMNISRIVIKSQTMASGSEIFISSSSNNNMVTDNVLADFTINLDEPLGVNLTYTVDSSPWRLYSVAPGPFNRLQLDILAVYADGTSVPILYSTNETYTIRLSFF